MKKKNEVYVVVDTPKKAKKLAKVLDMFGEPLCGDHSIPCALSNNENGWVIKFNHNEDWGTSTDTFGLKEVTIKELRNILAVEHLKAGDVVVVSNGYGKWIVKLTGKRLEEFGHSESYDMDLKNFVDHSAGLTIDRVSGASFIRYATEEEKALLKPQPKELTREDVEKEVVGHATDNDWDKDKMVEYIAEPSVGLCFEKYMLLEGYGANERADIIIKKYKPKPELEMGRWYKGNHEKLIFTTSEEQDGHVKAYGFGAIGHWFEDDNTFSWLTDDLEEATTQEVEQALIKEAKKRYKVGDKVKSLVDYIPELTVSSYGFNQFGIIKDLWLKCDNDTMNALVFRNGKWAEVVNGAPKFEVKIDIAKEELDRKVEELQASLNSNTGNYYVVNSKLYYKYNQECQLVFIRSAVAPMYGEWNLYSGKNINELI